MDEGKLHLLSRENGRQSKAPAKTHNIIEFLQVFWTFAYFPGIFRICYKVYWEIFKDEQVGQKGRSKWVIPRSRSSGKTQDTICPRSKARSERFSVFNRWITRVTRNFFSTSFGASFDCCYRKQDQNECLYRQNLYLMWKIA